MSPSKLHFERNLINVNIRRKDFEEIRRYRQGNEPFYNTVRRLVATRDTDKYDIEFMYNEQVKAAQTWMQRAIEAEKQLERQKTLL